MSKQKNKIANYNSKLLYLLYSRTKWVKVDGNEYHKDTAFVSSICEDSPQLGKIVNMYIINKNIELLHHQ